MPSVALLTRLALVAVLVAACGQTTPSELVAEEPSAAASVAESAAASAGASDAGSSASPSVLPTTAGPPQPLEAGTYLTPEAFEPAVSITVPDGWYGAAGQSGFAVGQGLNQAEERFADAELYLDLVPVSYDEALATLGELEGLVFSQPSSTTELDGHEATIFYGNPLGDEILLDELVPGIDLTSASYQQILIDVDGQTVLVRTGLHSEDAEEVLTEVIQSLQFP